MNAADSTVLVIEGDDLTRLATVEILQSCHYTVEAVEHGQEALDVLEMNETEFDLILCDVMLPHTMNGMEFLDALAQNERLVHIPVVMTSSTEEMDVMTSCLSKGAKDYLIKPLQMNTAKTLVRHVWLSRQQHHHHHHHHPSSQSVNNVDDDEITGVDTEHTTGLRRAGWWNLQILRQIGKGTHGTVSLARRKKDTAVVALKQIHLSQISKQAKEQADNEVILLKSLYHVNIVRFYDSFVDGNVLNIVMEYADGGNLRQLVKLHVQGQRGSFSEANIMSWFSQLVLAVAYMHSKSVLHRDLKSQNVFLTRRHVVKLGDFGISKSLARGDALANTSCGTPESMSPEICRGEPYGKKSDIWSIGCVLYEMITLSRPFEAATLPDMFSRICRGDYRPIPESFSRDLRLLVQLMLQQDPAKRPSIDDIYRFPFVQKPIRQFLTDHVTEFQHTLEHEAKFQQCEQPVHDNSSTYDNSTTLTCSSSSIERSSNSHVEDLGDLPDPPSPEVAHQIDQNHALIAAVVNVNVNDVMRPSDHHPHLNSHSNLTIQSHHFWSNQDLTSSLEEIAETLRTCVNIGPRRTGFLTSVPNCASASELVLVLESQGKTHKEALTILQRLIRGRVLNIVSTEHSHRHVHSHVHSNHSHSSNAMNSPVETIPMMIRCLESPRTFVRFQVDELDQALNERKIWLTEARPMMEVNLLLREQAAILHAKSQYPKLRRELDYQNFVKNTAEFQRCEFAQMPKHEHQAFFINLYNTMVLHGFIELGIPTNGDQVRKFEKQVCYQVDQYRLSLGDIRHGILRANRRPPGAFWGKPFDSGDPKLRLVLRARDPRSLLAIIDYTCTPIPMPEHAPVYRPGSRTDAALEHQSMAYCKHHISIDVDNQEIVLPKFIRVYRDDIGSGDVEMLNWISQYLENCPDDLIHYRIRYGQGVNI